MENVGQNTLFWYGTWPEVDADGVRCAVWQRDRLGYLATDTKLKTPASGATVTSCPIKCNASGTVKISLNVQGTGTDSTAKVDLLNEQFAPLPGYSAENCIVTDGLRSPVLWKTSNPDAPGAVSISSSADGDIYASHLVVLPTEAASGRIRVRVSIAGQSKANVRLYAIYCDDPTSIQSEADIPDLYHPPSNADELLAAEAAGNPRAGFVLGPEFDPDGFEKVTHCDTSEDETEHKTLAPSLPPTQARELNCERGGDLVAKLRELKELFEADFLTAEEFSCAKSALIPQRE
eukprot:COSAG02_NODE_2676_length_8272_cov_7.901994_4_plen_291_part_00